jgi:hypothetical protein
MIFDAAEEDQKRIAAAESALRKGVPPDYIFVGAVIDWQDDHYRNSQHKGVWTVRSFNVERRDDRKDGSESYLDLSLEKKIERGTSTVMAQFNAATMRPYRPPAPPENAKLSGEQMEIEFEPPIISPHKTPLRL